MSALGEEFQKIWDDHYSQPRTPPEIKLYFGLRGYYLLQMAIQVEQYKIREICNKTWTYIPKKVHGLIEISLWKKHGLAKVRVDCMGGEYKYHSYYGTQLLAKSNNFLHTIKELIKYK